MASIQKTDKGYRVQIKKLGIRDSETFPTQREAKEWAARREAEIVAQATKPLGEQHTLQDALRRYAEEVSPSKRGYRWEAVRLAAFEQPGHKLPLALPIGRVTPQHIADFRDARGAKVGPAAVLREITLLSSVFQTARLEWRWVDSNPCRDIRKPAQVKHRERVLAWWEIRKMLREMGYQRRGRVATTGQAVALCMLMAIRTGMRAGELCGLTWDQVFVDHCHLPMTKSGRARDVPLSTKARKVLERMKGWDDVLVFGLKTASLDALFRKYRERAGLSGFTWHDTRHTAATMISKKLTVLDLCKVFGWTDPKMAMRYYNPHASSLAALLG
ncbi:MULTISPECIES: site-specific integrase [unclassified Achromobacter]|uniref:tyrosine-type recombinase/integrase n=1 Tax=unclassified Achromobacter TaxID=2626865 RepID=UPI000B51719C|nr:MULTISPECIES: site-specific integrase [unclassified Achromobacter]OWT72998.1 integrase [Achromobacter sp. HZ34]OWT74217.1 integrase [Achromobacter sp. HZ28]